MSFSIMIQNQLASTKVDVSSGCGSNSTPVSSLNPGGDLNIPQPEPCTCISLEAKKTPGHCWIKLQNAILFEVTNSDGAAISMVESGVEQNGGKYMKFHVPDKCKVWKLVIKDPTSLGPFSIAEPTNVTISEN